jgi:Uma2 family endonuclease
LAQHTTKTTAQPMSETIDLAEPVELKRHRITADDYYRMAEAGILARELRVELIEGEIIEMATIGTRHSAVVNRLNRMFVLATGSRAIVSIQNSVQLNRCNVPEPDVVVLKPRDDFYASQRCTADDIFLVIEVADSSIGYDTRLKARLYATYGVAHYWVVDLTKQRLIRHEGPQAEAYATVEVLTSPGVLPLPGLEGLTIDVSELFPSP